MPKDRVADHLRQEEYAELVDSLVHVSQRGTEASEHAIKFMRGGNAADLAVVHHYAPDSEKGYWEGWFNHFAPRKYNRKFMKIMAILMKKPKEEPEKMSAEEQPSEDISASKACKILHDGHVKGLPITDQQRKMFGAACSRERK